MSDQLIYSLLNVHALASEDELKRAHRCLVRVHHPDMGGSADKMAEINVALGIMRDPKVHNQYRARLRSTHTSCEACRGQGATKSQRGFKEQRLVVCEVCEGSGFVAKE